MVALARPSRLDTDFTAKTKTAPSISATRRRSRRNRGRAANDGADLLRAVAEGRYSRAFLLQLAPVCICAQYFGPKGTVAPNSAGYGPNPEPSCQRNLERYDRADIQVG
jgi:hypothetical protein